ncbi:glycogen synthase GlgA [Paenibacillus senegalimassiliensis]|uniref:glycogen synthase GlgA n=1 Tax=Paenibacillus senegalimassiliensis TaxID=1737426 RepID=UPI00073E359A|nr:glycogen synthase GlgA [Paenibacillus senegalimassiliensis]
MNILFAAAEAAPLVKTGGLADVIGALPKALIAAGHDVRIMLPKYKALSDAVLGRMVHIGTKDVPVGWRQKYGGLALVHWDGLPIYLIDNEEYFRRDGIYGHGDDGERFAYFDRAVLELLPLTGFVPDIIHCHDWHTGMIPLLLREHYRHQAFYRDIRTVYTIHNLLYQGNFPEEILPDLLSLPWHYFTPEGVEYYGSVSFMKAGLVYANHITTVSPTYAGEIQTEHYGCGMDGLLRFLSGRLSGIVNGIDTELYNPETDLELFARYSHSLEQKQANKLALQRELGLPEKADVPLFCMITRLVEPKGLDLLLRVLDEWLWNDEVQFVLLGTGDPVYESWFREAAHRHPGKLAVQIRFSEALSRRIYAGSDMLLMPSRFEPCGISQLLALRYGTIPVVRETGGLNDTVSSYNEFTGEGNGFTFHNYNAHDMLYTLRRATTFYHRPEHWQQIVSHAFSGDYSWDRSARQYVEIYQHVLEAGE